MSMTIIVTRNVSGRMRGFLASTMLELSFGVYSAPRISPAVRARIWSVVSGWFDSETDASVVMIWQDKGSPGGQAAMMLGSPPLEFVEVDGVILTKRHVSSQSAD